MKQYRHANQLMQTGRRAATALVAMLVLYAGVQAESGWQRLAQMIAPASEPTQAAPRQFERASSPEVQYENQAPGVGAADPRVMARISPDNIQYQRSVTGLATSDKGTDGSNIDLGLESEDDGLLAVDLSDNPEMLRLMGDNPRFRYRAEKLPDPMLMPWVRNAAIHQELTDRADQMIEQGRYDVAIECYKEILKLNDERFNAQARAVLSEIAGIQEDAQVEQMMALVVAEEQIELPAWVNDNTTGVIIGPGTNLCLVGEFMLNEGDTLPNYPDITIASIQSKQVVYQIKDKTFEVDLRD